MEFSEARNPEPKGYTFFFFLVGKRTVFKLCPCKLPGSIWVPTFLTCKLTTLLRLSYRNFQRIPTAAGSSSSIPGLWPPPSPVSILHSPLLGLFSTVTTSWGSPSLCSLLESYHGVTGIACEIQGWLNSFRALFTTVS